MDFSDPLVIAIVLGGGLCIALLWLARLELRWRALFRGKNARTLESALIATQEETAALTRAGRAFSQKLAEVDGRLKKSISGIGTVRFNPFRGTSGSNQSFATAFLDEDGNGVVLSSLYSRERVSVFAKPIKNLSSEYELTEEERVAIQEAQK